MTAGRRFLQLLWSFVMVHYFYWSVVGYIILFFLWRAGLWWLCIVLVALYLPSFLNKDQYRSGRPWHSFRQHPIWRLTSRYIGVEVVRTAKLDAAKKYIFGLYPHGILILSRVAVYGGVWEKLFPGVEIRVLGASPMFFVPGSREICLWMGAVDAAKRVAVNVLKKFGLSLMVYPFVFIHTAARACMLSPLIFRVAQCIIAAALSLFDFSTFTQATLTPRECTLRLVGGSDEIFLTDPNSPVTTLVARKGFIKLAIQQGAAVVPAFVFGEKFLYHRRQIPQAIQNFFMRTLRLPLILFWGRWFTWLAYHDRERAFLTVVFGKPIDVVQKDEPTDAEIDVIWEQYIGQIRSLYDEHHKKFGYSDEETLVIKEADDEKRKRARATANGSALSPKSPDSNGSSRTTRTSRSSSSSSSKKKKKN